MEFSRTKAWGALEMLAGRGMPAAPFRGLGCCPGLTLDRQSLSALASLLLLWKPGGFPGGFSGLERGRVSPQESSRIKSWVGLGDCGLDSTLVLQEFSR